MIETEAPTTPEQKQKVIDSAVKSINKEHGDGTIMSLDSAPRVIPSIPTGIIELDYEVLGCGGFPRGRIVEMYGPESGGKTTAALLAAASAQSAAGRVAFIDAEHALDTAWMEKNGVNVKEILVSQPDYGEQALQIVQQLIETKAFDLIVVDSVAALTPKAELDGEIGDAHVGQLARMMSQAMRILNASLSKTDCVLLFINQIREKIGVTYGSNETTPGGRALKFYASVRLDVRRIGQVKKGDDVVGASTKIRAVKNKVAPPFKHTTVELLFDSGFNVEGSVLDAAVKDKIVTRSGAWYNYGDIRLGQGRDNAVSKLKEEGLLDKVREVLLSQKGKVSERK